jgi:hypothetical protein
MDTKTEVARPRDEAYQLQSRKWNGFGHVASVGMVDYLNSPRLVPCISATISDARAAVGSSKRLGLMLEYCEIHVIFSI